MKHENLKLFRETEENVRVFRRARGYIEAGWVQKNPTKLVGSTLHRCASRAIETAANAEGVVSLGPLEHFRRSVCDESRGIWEIWQWNDAPWQTKDRVLAAFDQVLADLCVIHAFDKAIADLS